MPIPQSILARGATFSRNLDSCLAPDYRESGLRREFLDPFFDTLGCNTSNHAGCAEAYKDAGHDDTLKTGTGTTAPGHSFRIGGMRNLFVEARKPAICIKNAPET